MGLFSREEKPQSETLYDTLSLANGDNLDSEYFEPDDSGAPFNAAMNAPILNNSRYGIDDAIELMRRLPKEHSELVVAVVKETLESTQINITDIIEDADNKSAQIRDRHQILEQEIAELRAQINEREEHIGELQTNLDETITVREKLQLSINQSQPANQSQPTQATPVAQVVAQESNAEAAPAQTAAVQTLSEDLHDIPQPIADELNIAGRREKRHNSNLPH